MDERVQLLSHVKRPKAFGRLLYLAEVDDESR